MKGKIFLNYISLFSSAGIGCYGFLEEGFKCVATSELLAKRLDIQKANEKLKYSEGYICGDISEKENKKQLYKVVDNYKINENVDDIDVILFTAPCQGMSVANHKKNDGTIVKNSLVVEALEIISVIKPKIFIAENVRSFMNTQCIDHDAKKTIREAFQSWLENDYDYEERILNFKEFGANSSRTRTLVIGVRKDIRYSNNVSDLFPQKEQPKTLKEIIGYLPSLKNMGEISPNDIYHNFKPYKEYMRKWIAPLKEGQSAFDNDKPDLRPHRIVNGEIVQNVNKNGDKYKRQSWDKVGPCIHTRNDIISSQNTVHPSDDRVFSIRELMLLMNIPENFKWTSKYTLKELNKLNYEEKKDFLKKNEMTIRHSIGEAIPTIIIQKIAKNIIEIEKKEFYSNEYKKNHKQLQFTF
ncbi:DNA cytosine methyltransferase [Staphylococcus chromogenes]|uniref:DNA cytosine methyltransferase n=1 Tax=Staphylococcus chromogenes TaxID=46126 RepID=UPI0021D2F4D0|nr:DNA cytosine methyltransferase [Staphylococcus chromogenes]UXS68065.1 DNA cytosine methyltransferase [Staphylococcus chromogenes]